MPSGERGLVWSSWRREVARLARESRHVRPGDPAPDLDAEVDAIAAGIESAIDAARREGAEAMREAAARECDAALVRGVGPRAAAKAIRSLPLPGEAKP
jgi:hypothetical protein